jgi:hypothetical protein
MSTRIEMEDGWLAHLREAEFVFFDVQLGPDITDDARRYCPVDTGRLQASLDHQVTGGGQEAPVLEVGSFPDDDGDVEYAAAVEMGFHGEENVRAQMRRSRNGGEHPVREHIRHANTPEQPYLRPALYQERYR